MNKTTPRELATQLLSATFLSPSALAERGLSRHHVARLVDAGHILRLRNGRYVTAEMHPDLVRAGLHGARLDCISLMNALDIFVLAKDDVHVQVDKGASRLPPKAKGIVRHWRPSSCARNSLAADLIEALAQACRCQGPREPSRHSTAPGTTVWWTRPRLARCSRSCRAGTVDCGRRPAELL